MVTVSLILSFFATLLATLIGVGTAFFLNRRAERKAKRRRVQDHLRAIENELEINQTIGDGNGRVINELQQVGSSVRADTDHYILNPFTVDSWDAALEEQIVDEVPEDYYRRLQTHYSEVKAVNEQIKRFRTEFMHTEIESSDSKSKYWSMVVAFWNPEKDRVATYALGPFLKRRCNSIRQDASELADETDDLIPSSVTQNPASKG